MPVRAPPNRTNLICVLLQLPPTGSLRGRGLRTPFLVLNSKVLSVFSSCLAGPFTTAFTKLQFENQLCSTRAAAQQISHLLLCILLAPGSIDDKLRPGLIVGRKAI